MRKKIKEINAVFSALIITIMSFVTYGELTIADEYILPENTALELGYIFQTSKPETNKKDFSYEKVNSAAAFNKAKTNDSQSEDVSIKLFGIVPVKTSNVKSGQRKYVVPMGEPFGLKLYSDGLIVVSIDKVETDSGKSSPAELAGLKNGDIIKSVNKKPIERTSDFTEAIEKSDGKSLDLEILRNDELIKTSLTPALASFDGKYKAGLWLRDSTSGIGTLTFYDVENGMFAGLGHAVCDADTTKIFPISRGEAVSAQIRGVYKGSKGVAGELCGVFMDKVLGSLLINGTSGVYGYLNDFEKQAKTLPLAMKQEVKTGAAQIIATIDEDGPKIYDIEILRLNMAADANERNMTIEITDEDLISKTGGIVQGMSGSPIIQGGYLVGAVTHVFLNNSLQGYGIFAENMLKTCENLNEMTENEADRQKAA